MEPYRAYLTGQRDKSHGKDKGMAEYLGEWERKWAQISNGNNSKGSFPFIALPWLFKDPYTDNKQRSRSFRSRSGHAWTFA